MEAREEKSGRRGRATQQHLDGPGSRWRATQPQTNGSETQTDGRVSMGPLEAHQHLGMPLDSTSQISEAECSLWLLPGAPIGQSAETSFHLDHHGPGFQQGGGKTGIADEMDGALGLGLERPMAVIACTPLHVLAQRYLEMMPACFSAAARKRG